MRRLKTPWVKFMAVLSVFILLERYGGEPELSGSWAGDAITILGDTRSSGSERQDDYFQVREKYKDIGLQLLALLFEEISDLRNELTERAKVNKNYKILFQESAIKHGGVNMKHSLKKHVVGNE